jgi:chromosome partitioning protein
MGRVVSLIARKGGVGKTTIAGNLASELGLAGRRVHLIDADPQRSLSVWASMGEGFLVSRLTAVAGGDESQFQRAVEKSRGEADLVVIDTPPGFTEPALLAANAADLVLLPCGASPLDLAAARDAVLLCRQMQRKKGNGKLKIGLVPSRYLPNSGLGRDLADSLGKLGEQTLPGIAHRVALAEAAITGLTIREYAPNSAARREFSELAKVVWRFLHEAAQTA